jgi:hypothetical protein
MLNYNLNIIEPLQQEKKNEDVNPYIYWDFDSRAVATDNNNIPTPAGFATMSIVAPNSNCIQVSSDAGNSFSTEPQFSTIASITGSNWPVTGSTTMSLNLVGISFNETDPNIYFYQAVSASVSAGNINSLSGSIIMNEFSASEFYNFFISGSIIHSKGNQYNPLVNVIATGSAPNEWNNYSGSKVTMNIVKDKDVPVSMSIGYITGSQISSFNYEYNFGVTASLTGSSNWILSSSFIYPTMSLLITGSGYSQNIISYTTSSIITASFVATNNNPYTIKATVAPRYIQAFTASLLLVGGGGASPKGGNFKATGGGGGGGVCTSQFTVVPNTPYTISVGEGGKGYFPGTTSSFAGAGTASYFSAFVNVPNGAATIEGNLIITASGGQPGNTDGNGGVSGFSSSSLSGSITVTSSFAGGTATSTGGAGGGGTGQVGFGSTNTNGGFGGFGYGINTASYYVPFSDVNRLGAGGGGGANIDGNQFALKGDGGFYGGGIGGGQLGQPDIRQGGNGVANTGGGAGGAASTNPGISDNSYGGDGGSGVATLIYAGGPKLTGQTGSFTYNGAVTVHTWNTGSYIFSYTKEPTEYPERI